MKSNTALIVVDVQNDFLPGGALAVPNGDEVISYINELIETKFHKQEDGDPYSNEENNIVVYTADWHPNNHNSFLEQGGTWPSHCVQFSKGAELALHLSLINEQIFMKGYDSAKDSYSGFEGRWFFGHGSMGLSEWLHQNYVRRVVIVGLALDYCVKATALDAVKLGYETIVYTPGTRAVNVNPGDGDKAIAEMKEAGVKFVDVL